MARLLFVLTAAIIAPFSYFTPSSSFAQDSYPNRIMTWVVPTAPGSPSDITMRLLADAVGKELGGTIIIQNKPGGGGTIGAAMVANAPRDGYMLLASTGDPLISQAGLQKSLPYDPATDFSFVTKLISSNAAMLARASLPANNAADLVALAKQSPAGLSYGSFGVGSFPHIIMETISRRTGAKFNAVHYRGSPQAIQELVSGEIAVTFGAAAAARLIAEGKLKAIAQLGETRGQFKDVPTFLEVGLDDKLLRLPLWSGLVGPRGIPRDTVHKIAAAAQRAVQRPDVSQFLSENAYQIIASSPEDFERDFREEYALVPKLIREMGIEPN
jgi:tripartite-type tricarboxylate transporter receptor subunit TctC